MVNLKERIRRWRASECKEAADELDNLEALLNQVVDAWEAANPKGTHAVHNGLPGRSLNPDYVEDWLNGTMWPVIQAIREKLGRKMNPETGKSSQS
jgi:hypothetical protein